MGAGGSGWWWARQCTQQFLEHEEGEELDSRSVLECSYSTCSLSNWMAMAGSAPTGFPSSIPTACVTKLQVGHVQVRRGGVGDDW